MAGVEDFKNIFEFALLGFETTKGIKHTVWSFVFEFALLGFETWQVYYLSSRYLIWICPFRVWNVHLWLKLSEFLIFEFALLGFETSCMPTEIYGS